ncbi:steroidogenic acute regulatory protein, mitochondrial [Lepisosteus oculatus]|uniref:START domain-containing protein 1 n=1 Tax=Lepisosteus oculatus TaxID=7918 RepID=W5MCC7_LEPOC|nr:PREDICTED: steroidogenic acute regulatory protein, mitochondrial-like [Lepisosteus oculatus]
MLPAIVKLCCGISYQHFRSMTGLQQRAVAAIGQEINLMQRGSQITLPNWASHVQWIKANSHTGKPENEGTISTPMTLREEELVYVNQGKEALKKALEILQDKDGWKREILEESGDVVLSKTLPGTGKVFRLEAVLDATPEELYDDLFVKVEEMNQWNPDVKQIKILKHIGQDTMVTHEVSAETAGNLVGQRDFVSVRHCCKQKSCIYLAGAATHLEAFPPQKGFVRAQDGPMCIILQPLGEEKKKCQLTWLLNMDLKGWLPKSIVNQVLPQAQADFTKHLRKRLSARLVPLQH